MRAQLVVAAFWLASATAAAESNSAEENEVCDSGGGGGDCGSGGAAVSASASKRAYANLRAAVGRIRADCGEICDTAKEGVQGKYYDYIQKDFSCRALFENKDMDAPSEFSTPPARLPKYLRSEFDYHGRVKIEDDYRDDSNGVTHFLNWTMSMMDNHVEMFRKGYLHGSYGKAALDNLYQYLTQKMDVVGKHVLVVGSQRPWIETLLLEAGVEHITTLDYVEINSEHPKISTITPGPLAEQYLAGTLPQYDVMVTFSSLEHSGLGRYGDALNPWGDLIAMAKTWCLLKPGGQALVGVPTGPDLILFNSARLYGPLMYSHLFANWKQVYTDNDFNRYTEKCKWCYQPLHIVQKEE